MQKNVGDITTYDNQQLFNSKDEWLGTNKSNQKEETKIVCGDIHIGKFSRLSSLGNIVECGNIILEAGSQIIDAESLKKCGNIFLKQGAMLGNADNLEKCGNIIMGKNSTIASLKNIKQHGKIILSPKASILCCKNLMQENGFVAKYGYCYLLDNTKSYTLNALQVEKSKIEAKIEQIYQETHKPPREDDIVFKNGKYTEDYERSL